MKFVLSKSIGICWPVTVQMPDPENPGKTVPSTLLALIKTQGQDDFLAAQEDIAKARGLRAQAKAERDYLASRVVGWTWEDAFDDRGEPMPYSADALHLALQQGWFRKAIWRALNEIAMGEPAEGN
ncbi:hypothetical protein GCM10007291_50160 [Gemmobacter nanjingensis]|jgi:hypothetical protein|uniref:Uncharacterized protein n=1 Tax=Gemmobacter nanjingensis TaxID=488454 RepID=A0ABQ3FTR9_9RHOB|nr:hypothetical protein [Gemmobacter nanjingensis]GHC42293.1 hypothetical protein GCM10007291_50160 [Gemmobacter nanjingensis]